MADTLVKSLREKAMILKSAACLMDGRSFQAREYKKLAALLLRAARRIEHAR